MSVERTNQRPLTRILVIVIIALVGFAAFTMLMQILKPEAGPKVASDKTVDAPIKIGENLDNVKGIKLQRSTPFEGKKHPKEGFADSFGKFWVQVRVLTEDEQKRVIDILKSGGPIPGNPTDLGKVPLGLQFDIRVKRVETKEKNSRTSMGGFAAPTFYLLDLNVLEPKTKDAIMTILRGSYADFMDGKEQ